RAEDASCRDDLRCRLRRPVSGGNLHRNRVAGAEAFGPRRGGRDAVGARPHPHAPARADRSLLAPRSDSEPSGRAAARAGRVTRMMNTRALGITAGVLLGGGAGGGGFPPPPAAAAGGRTKTALSRTTPGPRPAARGVRGSRA